MIRSGGAITLALVIDEIKHVSRGVDKTATELAITRLDRGFSELRCEHGIIYSKYMKVSVGFAIALLGLFAGIVLIYSKVLAIGILILIVCIPWLFIGFFHLKRDLKVIRA